MASNKPTVVTENDNSDNVAWLYSFTAAMVPFTAFCYGHSRGMTGRVVERVVRSPVGVYGLLALPFCTLAMEKSIYDTVQAWQGIDPNSRPSDRGGFPSGGAGTYAAYNIELKVELFAFVISLLSSLSLELPSFSLIPVQRRQATPNTSLPCMDTTSTDL